MTDRSVEDELAAEARKFGHAMAQLLRLHAQAGTWLERRKLRKEISRTLREQRHTEQVDRDHQLSWTEQMIDRYRAHSLAVTDRAADPTVDHDRRYRDAQALARHGDELRARIVTNTRLTPIEQGIALDGVDAATTFPHFETGGGRLFSNAHKVRGVEALRYRAQVARETVVVNERAAAERTQWRQEGLDDARRANAEEALLARINAAQTPRHRYRAEMTWSNPDGGALIESREFATEHTATDWMKANISRAAWNDGTALHVQTIDGHSGAVQYSDWGPPEAVADQLAVRKSVLRERTLNMLRERTLTGRVHREYPAERTGETVADREHEMPQRGGIERPPDQPTTRRTEQDAGTAAAVGQQRLAEIERRLREISEDRDRLTSRVGMLQRGMDAVTADRDQIRKSLASAEGRIEELKNRNIRLANEIGELRDRPDAAQVAEERDRYKRERDEAVAKLHARTPAKDRYGSAEKVAHERLGDTQAWPAPERPTGAQRNGHGRNGIDRSR
ncbi:hypothetical protein [Nocardia sp. bgisy134]|uniref:hypothetical protein n=1 Tax=Nocardia sp. bgisy134 TaxID=3413789 RepID=UPI003D708BFC